MLNMARTNVKHLEDSFAWTRVLRDASEIRIKVTSYEDESKNIWYDQIAEKLEEKYDVDQYDQGEILTVWHNMYHKKWSTKREDYYDVSAVAQAYMDKLEVMSYWSSSTPDILEVVKETPYRNDSDYESDSESEAEEAKRRTSMDRKRKARLGQTHECSGDKKKRSSRNDDLALMMATSSPINEN